MIAAAAWSVPAVAALAAVVFCACNSAVGAAWSMAAAFGSSAPSVASRGGIVLALVLIVLALAATAFALIHRNTKARSGRAGGAR